ncbi:hypothetical protein V6N12_069926 [Hibiscus sabdariffa]|uniref:Reverse transcriptase zinc-binding domain-containing protein n=1 Tax=Hibiscus sabdariffa TaxID=183260 RepID=A0ABR2FF99_9ROSI
MMKDMVTDLGDWDWTRLAASLKSTALDHIATVPPPRLNFGFDIPVWRWSTNRQFTTQSAYKYLMGLSDSPADSIWKRVWSLLVSQRVHTFMWLTLHQRHLTNVEQVRRQLSDSDRCTICNRGVEDLDHILCFCTRARNLWTRAVKPEILASFLSSPFDSCLRHNLLVETGNVLQGVPWNCRFAIFCWLLWKRRCAVIFYSDFIRHDDILMQGDRLVVEYVISSAHVSRQPSPVNVVPSGVLRDENGSWILDFGRSIGCCSVLVAELWAVQDMLARAWRLDICHLVLETDYLEVVKLLNCSSTTMVGNSLV